jgi:cytochrome c biogenesis protein CcmG, thiol:disulfide interchange protein DsbE
MTETNAHPPTISAKTLTSRSKRHRAITLIIAALALGVLGILVKGLTLDPSIVSSALIGKPAHDFEVEVLEGAAWLPKLNGNKIKLSDLRGKPLILNFWASWCVSCREEAAQMEQFWQKHRDRGIIVLGVAIQDTPEAAREFAKQHGKTYPIALDVSGKTSIDYGVYGVPESFFIDEKGIIVHKEAGPVTIQLLEEINSKYLASRSDRG